MTVRRVGPPPEEAPPHRRHLGRVLVTIDDLKALRDFLTRDGECDAAPIHIEFDGGDFTEPDELRTLSDMETKSLRLKSPRVEVVLNPSAAFAVGDRQEAEGVYRIWARTRQTRLKPRPMPVPLSLAYIMILLLTGALVIWLATQPFNDASRILDSVAVVSIVALGVGMSFWRHQAISRPFSYAVVLPLSLAEYRESRSSQTYPRRSWIVAIIAAIIAAAAVGVAIWAVLSR